MANSDDIRRLAEEMAVAYEERVKGILDIKRNTADFLAQTREEITEREVYIENLLADFGKAHQEMAEELRAKLATDEKTRKTETQAEIKERGNYIENLLADFDKAHQEMAEELRAKLATDEKTRKTETQAEIKERKETVRSMLDDFRKEQEETAAAWKGLLSTMQAAIGRTVVAGPVKVESKVAVNTVEKAIEAPIEEVEEVGEKEREDLTGRILDLLHDKSEGLKMAQIADMLGIKNWRTLIPVVRGLLDDEEIRKEDTLYFLS